ncbi:MAG: molybdopterin biosynthesis protein [Methanoregulaceae archaeon]|nr:molybdopterin biosynthesis protein [Methanoregulaceae archaeon]
MGKRYLSLCSYSEAMRLIQSSFPASERTETVHVTGSVGRVVARPVYAPYPVPGESIAAMDGIAVRSRDSVGATDRSPVTLTHYARVNTGNIIPSGFDAVIPVEEIWEEGGGLEIRKPAGQWQWIRPAGEDVRKGELVLSRGHQVTAFDVGALASYGIGELSVRTVKVGLIPTGSELVPIGTRPGPGQAVDTNTLMADLFLTAMGAHCVRYPIVPDDPVLIERALRGAVDENDIVIVSAGSSAGTRDFTAGVIGTLGELIFHGVAMMPGKPAILGKIDGKAILGLPGYPRAAQTVIREFAVPLMSAWGLPPPPCHTLRVRIAGHLSSDLGFDEFVPVSIGYVNGTCWAGPHRRGPGIQLSGVRANGFLHIPAEREGYEAESETDAVLTTDPGNIEKTIILAGAYDPSLDGLAHICRDAGLFLHVRDVGNTGAILALRSNSCHAAPMNLPPLILLPHCPPVVQHFLSPDITLVQVASMELGLASRDRATFDGLSGLRVINRPRDSSPRMVFDTLLDIWGIEPSQLDGYDHEVKSHRAVADAICENRADVGICTRGEAVRCGLVFTPVAREQYVLAIRAGLCDDPLVSRLVALIRSPGFKASLLEAGGYDVSQTGAFRTLSAGKLAPTGRDRLEKSSIRACSD